MSEINIRFSKLEETDKIINFIKKNWAENHVFVKSRELFLYCHDVGLTHLCYVIAEESSELTGICGYIPSNFNENPDIYIALWKVKSSSDPILGIKLIDFLKNETKCRIISCCGITEKVIPLYRFMGFQVGKLEHYYRLADKKEYRIAVVNDKIIPKTIPFCKHNSFVNSSVNLTVSLKNYGSSGELSRDFNFEKTGGRLPFKDFRYIERRYFNHIKYKYVFFGISANGETPESCFTAREVEQNDAKILRIVDYFGTDMGFASAGSAIDRLMIEKDYEYIDFYQFGIEQNILEEAGFKLRDKSDLNMIPNYFEPFEQKNVDIYFASSTLENFYMFKGDGDQDRPNIM